MGRNNFLCALPSTIIMEGPWQIRYETQIEKKRHMLVVSVLRNSTWTKQQFSRYYT
jgi:hypothetical protein